MVTAQRGSAVLGRKLGEIREEPMSLGRCSINSSCVVPPSMAMSIQMYSTAGSLNN